MVLVTPAFFRVGEAFVQTGKPHHRHDYNGARLFSVYRRQQFSHFHPKEAGWGKYRIIVCQACTKDLN
ncbi:hypothetical protein [Leptothermofonsia sp. ETS-13]|uniref:hypothetical protein n=1 Tax=Leptothermofonsia sp. ETS-13 TaxID=3035696 RepID=UPI003BA1186D